MIGPNFALLDAGRPEVARLVAAMLQARDAVARRSWSHPQAPTTEEWWADVLADPRARKRERRTDLAVKQSFYRLADEKRETPFPAVMRKAPISMSATWPPEGRFGSCLTNTRHTGIGRHADLRSPTCHAFEGLRSGRPDRIRRGSARAPCRLASR